MDVFVERTWTYLQRVPEQKYNAFILLTMGTEIMQNIKTFASDNASGVSPEIMQYLSEANLGHAIAYGNDAYTKHATELFKQHFSKEVEVHFVLTGTAANVLCLQTALKSYQAVICATTSHMNEHECGATEKFVGSKLLTVQTEDGKLTVAKIKQQLNHLDDEHFVQPRLITLAQPTELGTLYSLDDLRLLCQFAKDNNLYVHLDGARIANAACALQTDFKAITIDCGVDIVSFGGTKNGLMCGEAVIIINPELQNYFKYVRRQGMQLASKHRFLAAQFIPYLQNMLWHKNATHANTMAKLLAKELQNIPQVEVLNSVDVNMIFAKFPSVVIKPLQQDYFFYEMDPDNHIIRLVTTFDTQTEDINNFITNLQKLL